MCNTLHLAQHCQLSVSSGLSSRQLLLSLLFLLFAYRGSATDIPTSSRPSNQTTSSVGSTAKTSLSPSIPSSTPSPGTAKPRNPRLNCTAYNANITGGPCRSEGCLMSKPSLSDAQKLTEPCLVGNHQELVARHYSNYEQDSDLNAAQLPTKKWLLFKDMEGDCMNVLTMDTAAGRCVMPGFCGSQFPWYLKLDAPLRNAFGSEACGKLCVTDVTGLGIIKCCEKEVKVTLRSCGHFTIYYLQQPMSTSAIGHICADHLPALADPVGERKWSSTTSISTKYTSANDERIPKRLDQLTDLEREGLITVLLKIFMPQKVNVPRLLNLLEDRISEKLEKMPWNRTKREVTVRDQLHIHRVFGSPEYSSDGTLLYYTIYASTDSGVVIPRVYLLNAARELDNTEFAFHFAFVKNNMGGIPEQMMYPQKVSPTPSVSPATPSSAHQNTADWKIIIYIIAFTCCTIVLVSIILCIYRMKLIKNYRANRGRQLSKLQWWLLCERSTSPPSMDLTLKQQNESVKLVNSNCNGNGSAPLQDVECDNHK